MRSLSTAQSPDSVNVEQKVILSSFPNELLNKEIFNYVVLHHHVAYTGAMENLKRGHNSKCPWL